VPLKSLAGAANALNASASNTTERSRRDVRAEIMGIPPHGFAKDETKKMKTSFELP
jgi:hypothetical protein